jgi:hypothetical protein
MPLEEQPRLPKKRKLNGKPSPKPRKNAGKPRKKNSPGRMKKSKNKCAP